MAVSGNFLNLQAQRKPLAAWSEAAVLALIGDTIGPAYPIGSASLWFRTARSVAEKRLAEAVAGIVHNDTGEDRLARSTAIGAAGQVAAAASAPLIELIESAFDAAIAAIDREIARVRRRLDAIRPESPELSLKRRAMLAQAEELEREAREVRDDARYVSHWGMTGPDGAPVPADELWLRRVNLRILKRDVPALKRQAARIRGAIPPAPQSADTFNDRLSGLRAARQSLCSACRGVGRAGREAAA
jgi:hypothetical protein